MGALKKKRIEEIDVAKGLGILLVIVGHMDGLSSDVWKQFAASFHMPLFFFLSGLLLKPENASPEGFRSFAGHKARRMLVPYFLWALIYAPGIEWKQLIRIAYGNNRAYGEAGLWFLPTLFVAECVYYLIGAAAKKRGGATDIVLGTVCGALGGVMSYVMLRTPLQKVGWPFSVDIALTAVFFMMAGARCKPLFGRLREKGGSARGRALMAGAAALLLIAVFALSRLNMRFLTDPQYTRVVMARGSYGLSPLFLLGALMGTAAVLLLTPSLTGLRSLRFIGRNSLLFMCLNHLFVAMTTGLLAQVTDVGALHGPVRVLTVLVVLAAVTVCCSLTAWVIDRYVPVLSGKS